MILCISVLSVVISPFSFLILLIWFSFLCFLMSLANGLSTIYLLKEPAFGFVGFCYGLFCFFCIYFCPNFYNFLLLTLRFFISSFSGYFRCQFSSVAQYCPTLCNPMNCSTPGLPVYHQLPEFTQTHIHQVGDAIQPSHPLSSPSPPAPNPSQHQSLFQWVNSSHEVAKVLDFQL